MEKILILGGTAQQIKLIEAAKRKGYYTIVTDYLSDSLAKRMADKSYMYDINDIDGIVNMCKDENVQGVKYKYNPITTRTEITIPIIANQILFLIFNFVFSTKAAKNKIM